MSPLKTSAVAARLSVSKFLCLCHSLDRKYGKKLTVINGSEHTATRTLEVKFDVLSIERSPEHLMVTVKIDVVGEIAVDLTEIRSDKKSAA